jgi:hypothetical protein
LRHRIRLLLVKFEFAPTSFADLIGESMAMITLDSQGYVRRRLTAGFAAARE